MARTNFRKSKSGKHRKKTGTRRKRVNKSRKNISRSYRGKGGCENDSCALSGSSHSTSPVWTSTGGAISTEQMSNDMYNYETDRTFYSAAN
jgi:hypothetical protein